MAHTNLPESVARTLLANVASANSLPFLALEALTPEVAKVLSSWDVTSFVIKPDYPFGKRGKNNLIGLNQDLQSVTAYLAQQQGQQFKEFTLTRFVVTPFIAHTTEYYLAFRATVAGDEVLFSTQGGIDIEENWESLAKVTLPLCNTAEQNQVLLQPLVKDLGVLATPMLGHIEEMLRFFAEYGLDFLEFNPFIYHEGTFVALDMKATLDTTALATLQRRMDVSKLLLNQEEAVVEENYIRQLDESTGASLKLKLLNRDGALWPMIAGGGASIIVFDYLVEQGLGNEIGFYGEYSGNPPFELMFEYAKTVIALALSSKAKTKTLIIMGANANFTDILVTMKAIAKALEEKAKEINSQKVEIFVRRPGPNSESAYDYLRTFSTRTGIPIHLQTTDTMLTEALQTVLTERMA